MNMRIADRFTGLFGTHTVGNMNKGNGVYEVTHILRYGASRCAKNVGKKNQKTFQSDTSFHALL